MKTWFPILLAIVIIITVLAPAPVNADDFDCTTLPDIPFAECQALVALYNNTGGPTWTNKTNWLTTTWPWYGVTPSEGYVQQINLTGNNLTGVLPAALKDLTYLTLLNLENNLISGSIPLELGNLVNLGSLALNNNLLSGSLPEELGQLVNLTLLNISDNLLLSGPIPLTFTNLPLDTFYFSNTALCEPTDEAFLIWKATVLNWDGTNVICQEDFTCELVDEIPTLECEALVALYNSTAGDSWTTNTNWLTTTWPWYGVTVAEGYVQQVLLYGNNLTGVLPAALKDLTHLTFLDLGHNLIGGSIPVEIGNITTLTHLYLFDNQLGGGIPESLGNLTSLLRLSLYDNLLSGSIPSALGLLSNLTYLNLQQNDLSGSLPVDLGNLSHLQNLYLGANIQEEDAWWLFFRLR